MITVSKKKKKIGEVLSLPLYFLLNSNFTQLIFHPFPRNSITLRDTLARYFQSSNPLPGSGFDQISKGRFNC